VLTRDKKWIPAGMDYSFEKNCAVYEILKEFWQSKTPVV
jgi:hypothetical protein